ncbi:MAG TPA: MBL fold metallo-hydrolase [Acidobacteria bacterium]|nr:MBL fold metallo-hydrolase [Acidobacteriota bacterium]
MTAPSRPSTRSPRRPFRRRTLAWALTAAVWSTAAAAQPSGTLQVTLLGTGNPRPSLERFGPSILVEAGARRVLIDAGRGATQRLFEIAGRDALVGLDAVFLTHLHSDHVVGLPDLWLTSWVFGRARALELIGPPGTADMASHLEQAYQWDITARSKDEGFPLEGVRLAARDVQPGVVYERDGMKVTAFAVDHGGVLVPAYGFRVDFQGRSVAFSGDTRFFEPLVEHARGVDVLVHEVISPEVELRRTQVQGARAIDAIIAHHATPEQAGTIFSKVKPRLAVYSHIVPSPTTAEDLIGPTRRTWTGPLAVGYDLMTIVIGDTIEVHPRKVQSDK